MSGRSCAVCGQVVRWSENLFDDDGEWLHFIGRWMVGTACPSEEAVEHFQRRS